MITFRPWELQLICGRNCWDNSLQEVGRSNPTSKYFVTSSAFR